MEGVSGNYDFTSEQLEAQAAEKKENTRVHKINEYQERVGSNPKEHRPYKASISKKVADKIGRANSTIERCARLRWPQNRN